ASPPPVSARTFLDSSRCPDRACGVKQRDAWNNGNHTSTAGPCVPEKGLIVAVNPFCHYHTCRILTISRADIFYLPIYTPLPFRPRRWTHVQALDGSG